LISKKARKKSRLGSIPPLIAAKPAVISTIDPRLAAMYKDGTQLIGIDKSSSDLLSMMMSKGDEASKFQQQDEDSFYCRSWRNIYFYFSPPIHDDVTLIILTIRLTLCTSSIH
jgi:hypothetical protein